MLFALSMQFDLSPCARGESAIYEYSCRESRCGRGAHRCGAGRRLHVPVRRRELCPRCAHKGVSAARAPEAIKSRAANVLLVLSWSSEQQSSALL